ncbi:uncharacterized protein I303_100003 [Kwoniella dejecticola CBS 10117]|uniref:LamG-like jellyroll fold domain-containing protein n=1 Tax=Kwoniella dejecticola CBS 10117 TaxID=1296121 RepID=A0A1A6ADP5_9TREE|nr:uncharacterized protein I303_00003 [Kwoniella dejecticola CBS 10117]OBR88192.1 hypothetical protein I303_00003 [Kwoniella dejecticola CBS 10117]
MVTTAEPSARRVFQADGKSARLRNEQVNKFVASKIVSHQGKVVGVALDATGQYWYNILDLEGSSSSSSINNSSQDSQAWMSQCRPIRFPSDLVYLDAQLEGIYPLPKCNSENKLLEGDNIDPALVDPCYSSTARLSVVGEDGQADFGLISDSTYIYIFRQSRKSDDKLVPQIGDINHERGIVDSNILMDRFVLAGTTLINKIEVRYQRSRSFKPLNAKDNLSAWDMDGQPFFESTCCINQISGISSQGFTVIRTPTRVNDVYRWNFFCISEKTRLLEYYSFDSSDDGRPRTRGKSSYYCTVYTEHINKEPTFALAPGACSAINTSGYRCNHPLTPMASSSKISEAQSALFLDGQLSQTYLRTSNEKGIDLNDMHVFRDGFTLEAWILPRDPQSKTPMSAKSNIVSNAPSNSLVFDFGTPSTKESVSSNVAAAEADLSPADVQPLFNLEGDHAIGVTLERIGVNRSQINIGLTLEGETTLASKPIATGLATDERAVWSHVALVYHRATRTAELYVNGVCEITLQNASGGALKYIGKIGADDSATYFAGALDEIRLWGSARSKESMLASMNSRLPGNDPDLKGLWRLDESEGTTCFDSAGKGLSTRLSQSLQLKTDLSDVTLDQCWIKSTAALTSRIGISRYVFRFKSDYQIVGAPSATLYFEQEDPIKVSDDGAKNMHPQKTHAHVLLAFGVTPSEIAPLSPKDEDRLEESASLAFLDFDISNDGIIAAPVGLLPLSSASLEAGLPDNVAQAKRHLIELDETYESKKTGLTATFNKDTLTTSSATPSNGNVTEKRSEEAANQQTHKLEDLHRQYKAIRRTILSSANVGEGEIEDSILRSSEWRLQLLKSKSDLIKTREDAALASKIIIDEYQQKLTVLKLDRDSARDYWIRAGKDPQYYRKSKLMLSRYIKLITTYEARRTELLEEYRSKMAEKKTSIWNDIFRLRRRIDLLQASPSNDNVEPSLLSMDGRGLKIYGAVLDAEICSVTGNPGLHESATGTISLLARGLHKTLSAYEYDAGTSRTLLYLHGNQTGIAPPKTPATDENPDNSLAVIPRSNAITSLSVQVDPSYGASSTTVDIVLTATVDGERGGPLTETWTGVPKDVARLSAVINGTASRSPSDIGRIGCHHPPVPTIVVTAADEAKEIPYSMRMQIPTGTLGSLVPGSAVVVGGFSFMVNRFTPIGSKEIEVTIKSHPPPPVEAGVVKAIPGPAIGSMVTTLIYDYALAVCDQKPNANLSAGSLIASFLPMTYGNKIYPQTLDPAVLKGKRPGLRAARTAGSLEFDGAEKACYAALLKESRSAGLPLPTLGEGLSLELWFRPNRREFATMTDLRSPDSAASHRSVLLTYSDEAQRPRSNMKPVTRSIVVGIQPETGLLNKNHYHFRVPMEEPKQGIRIDPFDLTDSATYNAFTLSFAVKFDRSAASARFDIAGIALEIARDYWEVRYSPFQSNDMLPDSCRFLFATEERPSLTYDTWYHVSLVYNLSEGWNELYIDGDSRGGFLIPKDAKLGSGFGISTAPRVFNVGDTGFGPANITTWLADVGVWSIPKSREDLRRDLLRPFEYLEEDALLFRRNIYNPPYGGRVAAIQQSINDPHWAARDKWQICGQINGKPFTLPATHRDPAGNLLCYDWNHLAVTTAVTYGLDFDNLYTEKKNPSFRLSSYLESDRGATISDGSIAIAFVLDDVNRNSILVTKGQEALRNNDQPSGVRPNPYQISVVKNGHIRFHWVNDAGKVFMAESQQSVRSGVATRLTIQRKYNVKTSGDPPRVKTTQDVTITLFECEYGRDAGQKWQEKFSFEEAGTVADNNEPLSIGGASWLPNPLIKDSQKSDAVEDLGGWTGQISEIRIYNGDVLPENQFNTTTPDKSMLLRLDFSTGDGDELLDLCGNHPAYMRGDRKPKWSVSRNVQEQSVSVYVNGVKSAIGDIGVAWDQGVVPLNRQLVLGGYKKKDGARLGLNETFQGKLAEVRLWNIQRTEESINDSLFYALPDVDTSLIAYFDMAPPSRTLQDLTVDLSQELVGNGRFNRSTRLIEDKSLSSNHLVVAQHSPWTLELDISPYDPSDTPIGTAAPCYADPFLNGSFDRMPNQYKADNSSCSIAEYGEIENDGSGVYKRAYSHISSGDGSWHLWTGHKIGTIVQNWVAQRQTDAEIKGFIEGPPPFPLENFWSRSREHQPHSVVRFTDMGRTTYSYNSRSESGKEVAETDDLSVGAKWTMMAGLGLETEVASGKVHGNLKTAADFNNSTFNSETLIRTDMKTTELKVEQTGQWDGVDNYMVTNNGIALVESRTADVYALRLKVQGGKWPLIAYSVKPNLLTPADVNLVTFPINKRYLKQGCLDGNYGGNADPDFKDDGEARRKQGLGVSYFNPKEAYALQDKIRKLREAREAEYTAYKEVISAAEALTLQRMVQRGMKEKDLPAKKSGSELWPESTARSVCNTYVWTASGGFYSESYETINHMQSEYGGSTIGKSTLGGGINAEIAISGVEVSNQWHLGESLHFTLNSHKEKSSEDHFMVHIEASPGMDLRVKEPGVEVIKQKQGAVDAYRWMTFFQEPDQDYWDILFNQVIDPLWLLGQGPEGDTPEASLLRATKTKGAKSKCWRISHRVTFVSRVLGTPGKDDPEAQLASQLNKLNVDSNWQLIQALAPQVSGCADKSGIATKLREVLPDTYPLLMQSDEVIADVVELLAEYMGLA